MEMSETVKQFSGTPLPSLSNSRKKQDAARVWLSFAANRFSIACPMETPYYALPEVERIAEHPEAVLRNLQITQSYAELSARLATRTGPCANWCTYATWASAQAGRSIRREDLRQALDRALDAAPELRAAADELVAVLLQKRSDQHPDQLRQLLRDTLGPAAVLDRAADAVGRGNQKVYAEIGRAFARFIDSCLDDARPEVANIDAFCRTLRDGDPPDGQACLQRAFRVYYQAFFVENKGEKAQLILLANLEIGFHEQTRLQPEIAEALEAAVPEPADFTRRLLAALFPYRGWLAYVALLLLRWAGRRSALDLAISRFIDRIRCSVRRVLTDHLMTLELSQGRVLRLGHDLRAAFPQSLRHIELPALAALLARIDPTPDALRDTGATDWADLGERLHFIADLFRSSQEDSGLLDSPFSAAQVTEIKAGKLPLGL